MGAIKKLNIGDISYYFCPHVPEDKCNCRKPFTGLFHACQENFTTEIDWKNSIMVGDKMSDICAAGKMNIENIYLIDSKYICTQSSKANDISFSFRWISKLNEVKFK